MAIQYADFSILFSSNTNNTNPIGGSFVSQIIVAHDIVAFILCWPLIILDSFQGKSVMHFSFLAN